MVTTTPREREASAGERSSIRHAWVDNLRVIVIIGVIGAHVSLIYALDVGWYYEERTAGATARAVLAGIFSPGLVFGMGLLFFVAGLFTPSAFARKGPGNFITGRLRRLGPPVAAYLFVVNPAMNVLGDRATGINEGLGDYFRRTYFDDVELGISWFALALLVSSLAYAFWRRRHIADTANVVSLQRSDVMKAISFIAVASFVVRLVWPFLATDGMWGLNLWEYPQMMTLFALGVLAEERGWLVEGLPAQLRRMCGLAAAVGFVITAALGVALTLTDEPDPFLGGLRIEATVIPLAEAMIAVGMSLWTADWFRHRWNRAGTLIRGMGRGSFTAYLVHAPITVILAVGIRGVDVSGEIKFVTVFALAVVASFGLGWLVAGSHADGRIL